MRLSLGLAADRPAEPVGCPIPGACACPAERAEAVPAVWVIPGDDNANCNGFVDAMAYQKGEFTLPLYRMEKIAFASPAPTLVEPPAGDKFTESGCGFQSGDDPEEGRSTGEPVAPGIGNDLAPLSVKPPADAQWAVLMAAKGVVDDIATFPKLVAAFEAWQRGRQLPADAEVAQAERAVIEAAIAWDENEQSDPEPLMDALSNLRAARWTDENRQRSAAAKERG